MRVSDGLAGTWSRLGWAGGPANFFGMAWAIMGPPPLLVCKCNIFDCLLVIYISVCAEKWKQNVSFFFAIWLFFRNNFMFGPLNNLMSFLDPLLGVMAHGAEVTHLGAMAYGAEVSSELATQMVA